MTGPQSTTEPGSKPRRRRGSLLAKENRRLLYGLVLGALVALFAVLNLDKVKVDWIVGSFRTPLIIVIAVSFLLGALAGYLAPRARSAGSKAKR
jgi:putative membrane protein